MLNANKPHLWKRDIAKSVDCFNKWFMQFAPEAFQANRLIETEKVKEALLYFSDLSCLHPRLLKERPEFTAVLRMCTCPPIARDRLSGLSGVHPGLVYILEKGRLPSKLSKSEVEKQLELICATIIQLVDGDIFPWLEQGAHPSDIERERASSIVADRKCGAVADPIIRNAQEQRQLKCLEEFFTQLGYKRIQTSNSVAFNEMTEGTFAFRFNVMVGESHRVNIPIDCVVQPKKKRKARLPILIEAKSAGDFTNTNKRRKEEATKVHQLKAAYGPDVQFVLFLCGYFDSGYLGYEAAEGIDWVWEHRISDLLRLNLT